MQVSRTALAILGLCLVTACGPKGGNSTATGGAPAAAPTSGPDQVINFSDLPHQKAGLWKQVMDTGDGHPETTTTCVSGKTPALKTPKECEKLTIKRTFMGAIIMDMACTTPEYSMTVHAEATGDFQTSMTSQTTMTMTAKGQPTRTLNMHGTSVYVGPCAPGQTPDDETDSSAAPG